MCTTNLAAEAKNALESFIEHLSVLFECGFKRVALKTFSALWVVLDFVYNLESSFTRNNTLYSVLLCSATVPIESQLYCDDIWRLCACLSLWHVSHETEQSTQAWRFVQGDYACVEY